MSHLDGRWRCEPLVYFGSLQDSSVDVAGGAFREARGYVPGPLLQNIWAWRTTRMYSEFRSFFSRYWSGLAILLVSMLR